MFAIIVSLPLTMNNADQNTTTLTVVATASFVAFWYFHGPSSDAGKPSLFECFHIKDVTARYPCPSGISADLRSENKPAHTIVP